MVCVEIFHFVPIFSISPRSCLASRRLLARRWRVCGVLLRWFRCTTPCFVCGARVVLRRRCSGTSWWPRDQYTLEAKNSICTVFASKIKTLNHIPPQLFSTFDTRLQWSRARLLFICKSHSLCNRVVVVCYFIADKQNCATPYMSFRRRLFCGTSVSLRLKCT